MKIQHDDSTAGAKGFVEKNITAKIHTITAFVDEKTGECLTRLDFGYTTGCWRIHGFNAGYRGEGPTGLAWLLDKFGIAYRPEDIYSGRNARTRGGYRIFSFGKYPVN